jgi:uracil-DNA glycosylase family 4
MVTGQSGAPGMEREQEVSTGAAASALAWWVEAGVDTMIAEAPRDWLRAPKEPPAPPATGEAGDAPPDQLDLFETWLKESPALPFASPSAPRICPAGDPASGLMILADMPSGEDCASGTLISGEAGRLFDRMLAAIGRDRASVYLASLSCLRSPGGILTSDSAKSCATLARHHIGLVRPKALLLLGDAAAKAMLGLSVPLARGRWHEISTHSGPVRTIVTIAPQELLREPGHKRFAWQDLLKLVEEVKR